MPTVRDLTSFLAQHHVEALVTGSTPAGRSQVARQAAYEAATCAIQAALLNSPYGRALRQAIRKAILSTLEGFAVIKKTRGGPC